MVLSRAQRIVLAVAGLIFLLWAMGASSDSEIREGVAKFEPEVLFVLAVVCFVLALPFKRIDQ